jgi:MFS family permease
MLPLAGSVVGALAGGAAVDAVLRRTRSRRLSRSGIACGALVLSGLCTLAAIFAPGAVAMVLVLSLGSFCFGMGSPASWAAAMDISGRHTQLVFALLNMCGNAGALVCPILLGRLFDHIEAGGAAWSSVLYLFAAIYAGGALCWAFLNPERSAVSRDQSSVGAA